MPQTVQQTLQDPKFYGLPTGEQQKVLATLDPNYARLPLPERDKVLQIGRQKFGSGNTQPAATPPSPDLTTNTIDPATGKGYGLYRMGSYDFNQGQVSKPEIMVPYNRVTDAQGQGYQLHPDEAPRYQNDTAHAGPMSRAAGQVKDLLGRMTAPMPDRPLNGTLPQNAAAALTNVGQLPFNVVNRIVRGVAGMPQGTAQQVQDFAQGNPTSLNSADPVTMAENTYKGMQQDTADLGPMAAMGNVAGDLGTMGVVGEFGPKVVEAGSRPIMDVVSRARNLPESLGRVVTGTGAGPVKDLINQRQVENTQIDAVNQDRLVRQQQDQANADYDHRANLLKLKQDYDQSVRDAQEKSQAKTASDQQKVQAKNLAAKQEYEQAVRDANEKARTGTADDRAQVQARNLAARQKYEQSIRDATESARTGTTADQQQVQAKNLAAKQKYEQSVRDAHQAYQTARAAAEQANADALRTHNQKIGQTAQQNRNVTAAERARTEQAAHLQVGGSQLIYGLNRLNEALRARANDMYGAVREKMAGASLPSDTLANAVKAAQEKWIRGSPEKIKEFNAMLTTGEAGPELTLANQTAQNMGYKDFRHAISNPLTRNTLSRALPPDVWEAAIGQGTMPISWNDLQGFYEETGARVADGPQPGKADIYKALQQVHDEIGNQMADLAKTRGADKDFNAARKFYREYMNTFHEPTGPSSSGSPVAQALRAKDPAVAVDKFAGDSGDRGIADLRRFSDGLANLAQDVRRTAQTKVSVPARQSVVAGGGPKITPVPAGANLPLPPIQEPIPAPRASNLPLPPVVEPAPAPRASNLPLPPVLPEPETIPVELKPHKTISREDIAEAKRAAAEASAGNWWRRGRWAAATPIFQIMRSTMGGHIPPAATMGLQSAGMLYGAKIVSDLVRYPPMVRFLAEATPADTAMIPPEMRGDLPGLVSIAQRQGIKVSPALAAIAAGASSHNQQSQFTPAQAMQAVQGASR